MPIIAVANQKGGVAKTTTSIHLGAAIAEQGHTVLLVDLDPQGHLAEGLGIVAERLPTEMSDVIEGTKRLVDVIIPSIRPNLDLAPSNIRAWNPDPDDLSGTLLAHAEHLVPGRTEQDVLYEVLLKLGLDLAVPIATQTIAGKPVHSVGGGVLMVCLSDGIDSKVAEDLALGIAEWRKALAPAGETVAVFKDSGFADDVAKTNLSAILEQSGFEKMNIRSL